MNSIAGQKPHFSWMKKLFDHGRQIEITVFSTPFDETAVDLLEDLNAPSIKSLHLRR